jgi:hypothetical protein
MRRRRMGLIGVPSSAGAHWPGQENQIKAGLTFRDAMACLGGFAASSSFGGLVVTEFNPDHADEEGELANLFVREVADVLAGKAP